MPHVTLHLLPGRSKAEKAALTEALIRVIGETIGAGPETVSVRLIVTPDWAEFYRAEIAPHLAALDKVPGYSMPD